MGLNKHVLPVRMEVAMACPRKNVMALVQKDIIALSPQHLHKKENVVEVIDTAPEDQLYLPLLTQGIIPLMVTVNSKFQLNDIYKLSLNKTYLSGNFF